MSAETRLDDLLRRWEELRRHGKSPTPEEICRDAPELLRPFLRALADLDVADRALQTMPVSRPGDGTTRHEGGHAPAGGPTEVALHPGAEPVPGYRLVTLLGRGGFGEVWKAEGPGGFPLALKFVRLAGSVGAVELRSLEVIKGIRHPNLLSTFGTWQVGPYLIIALELADRTLGDRLREALDAGLPGIPGPELLEYFREAAKGIDFLNEPRHAIGGKVGVRLQHRDIKPANILLVGTGVKVADFGLIRLLEHTHASHTGALTPSYAPPEFFAGQTSPSSDQYSLAVTYCQLRSGQLPFRGPIEQLIYGHVHAPPDLDMLPPAERPVVARALAKRPSDRWTSCRAFVEALTQAQARTAGRACEVTLPEEDARPHPPSIDSRRRRPWRAGIALGLLSSAVLLAVALALLRPSITHQNGSDSGKDVAKQQKQAIASAEHRVNPLEEHGGAARQERREEVRHRDRQVEVMQPVRFAGHRGAVRCVAWFPSGQLVVSGGDDGAVRLWDPRDGEPSRSLTGHQESVTGLAISPDGKYLLTAGRDQTVRYWDLQVGQELWKQATHESPVHCVAISPDGKWGLSASQDMTLRLWDLREERERTVFETEVEYWSVAFTPDGHHILAAGDSSIVVRLQRESGQEVGRFTDHQDVVWSVACASGSDRAASGGGDEKGRRDYRVRVWKATDGRPWRAFDGHTGAVGAVAITADGRRVLSGSADRTVRFWDCESGEELRCFQAHQGQVTCVAISQDGLHAVSGGLDGAAYVWTLPSSADGLAPNQ